MDIFSFVYFFSFIVYIYFGIYSLFLNRRSLLNILFFTYCIFLSIWSLGNTFLYSALDIKSAWLWYKIGGLGWCFIQPWGLLFALVLSKKDKLYKNPFFVISIFIPGILFYYKVLFDTLFVADFDIQSKIIIGYFSNFTLLNFLFLFYNFIFQTFFIYFIWQWGKHSPKKSIKKQSYILVSVAFVPLLFGSFFDGVLPYIVKNSLKPTAIVFLLFWIIGVWYVMIKYKFLKIKSFYPAFEEISSKMTDMLIIINHHGIIMKINKKMEELSNYSEFELISDDINKVLLCEDRRWYKKITKDNLLNFETSVLTKKGEAIPANIFTSIMKDEDEGDVGIIIIGQDIRLTRQLENEIEEREIAEKILKESEERYKTLVTKIPEVILIHKYDLIVYVNQSIGFLIGYSPEEVIGTTLFKYVYDEYKPILMQNLKKRLAGEDLPDHEMVIMDKNGNKKTVIFRSTTTIYDNQLMFLSLLIDITERKRNEEDLRKAKESAEIANKTKSEFLATMSHEIRTPINGILGMLSLTSNTPLSDEQKKYMTMARTSCEYLANVVESILDYSRIEAGKIEIENVDFDLYKLMNQVLEEFKIKADEKKLNISLKIDRNVDRYINGDVNKLKQILVNLVNNAVKFTEKGSVEIVVDKNNDLCDKIELKFIIKDTGIGIAREKINKLFQTFSQADSSSKRKYGGTGLGLAISKKLVEMMKGNIWLYTEENVGTTFYFTCILSKSDKDSCLNDEDFSEEEFENKKTIKILIAEDNVVNQEFMSVLLTKKGYIVECVDNGLEVLEKLKIGTYDLILMDVEMPEMDGIETTSKIRENERENNLPNIPIIALTAYAMKGDKDKCMKAGMNDYISKPIKVDLLFSKMEKIIS